MLEIEASKLALTKTDGARTKQFRNTGGLGQGLHALTVLAPLESKKLPSG